MSFRIGSIVFKDFTHLQKYTRNLINNILGNNSVINKDDEYFDFFADLITRHKYYNDIVGCGISNFQTFETFNKCIGIKAVRIDKTESIFSWVKLTKKIPKENYKSDLNNALRYSIYKQINFYKLLNDCSKCKFCDSKKDIQIDHCGEMEFVDIVNAFIKDNPPPKTFDRCPYTQMKKLKKKDFIFESKWQDFHCEKMELQPLCKICNREKNFLKIQERKEKKDNEPFILKFD
jgi:hypothetical protein